MLHSLLPKAHAKTLVLPLLGSIADGFDDWLAATGYTAGSRRNTIRMLPHVDNDLRKRRVLGTECIDPAAVRNHSLGDPCSDGLSLGCPSSIAAYADSRTAGCWKKLPANFPR